jgi:diguanylate cyclase (GGDEF)-like protein
MGSSTPQLPAPHRRSVKAAWGSVPSRRLWTAIVALLMFAVAVIDVRTPHVELIPLLALLGLAASTWSTPRVTAALAVLSIACGAAASAAEGLLVTADFAIGGFALIVTDVFAIISSHQRTSRERQLHDLARTDALTGLPNRSVTIDTLHRQLHRRHGPHPITVLFVDVDHFKSVNDQHGHAAGDTVLREIGRRLVSTVRTDDLVTRYAGDEFVVICTSIQDMAAADRLCGRCTESFAHPIELGDSRQLNVTASIGGVLALDRTLSADDILARADAAMFTAKTTTTGHHILALPPPNPTDEPMPWRRRSSTGHATHTQPLDT